MGKIWEAGDLILCHHFSNEALQKRDYVFEVIDREPGPFMDMRRARGARDEWIVRYNAEGCWMYDSILRINSRQGKLKMSFYLKLMRKILCALEAAEERMIMTSSFVINRKTLWYDEKKEAAKIMYVPVERNLKDLPIHLWKSVPTAPILLELLEAVCIVDPGFCDRWPFLNEAYQNWNGGGWGRHRCLAELRRWEKEFPTEGDRRNYFGE